MIEPFLEYLLRNALLYPSIPQASTSVGKVIAWDGMSKKPLWHIRYNTVVPGSRKVIMVMVMMVIIPSPAMIMMMVN